MSRTWRLRALWLFLMWLLFPMSAQGERVEHIRTAASPGEGRPFGPVEREHLGIAAKHWGPPPCPAGISGSVVSDEEIDRRRSPGVFAYAERWPLEERCSLVLAQRTADGSYTERCAVMLHEVGHLHGRQHNNDPSDPMFANFAGIRPPRVCVRGARRRAKGCARKRSDRAADRCYVRWAL